MRFPERAAYQALEACQTAPEYWTKLSLESYYANTVKYTQCLHKQAMSKVKANI